MVTGRDIGDVGACCLDDASALVAKDVRLAEWEAAVTIDEVEVAVAHARGCGTNEDFSAGRLIDVDVFNG
jgi:hypothetical protein